ncbi:hypothetical protein BHE74_00024699 [Ensete ventricosum]|nr:hypothetical protein GW17_00004322 [Ensete ventricosum]RWW67814.1 hypothetical protein BHE74_00024699 [Ensete ventricosum]RZR75799.1 hypothetical protein BHM03_00000285 [Ensete ventricosum]
MLCGRLRGRPHGLSENSTLIDPRFMSDATNARQLSSSTPHYNSDTFCTLPSRLPVWVPELNMRRAALTQSRGRYVGRVIAWRSPTETPSSARCRIQGGGSRASTRLVRYSSDLRCFTLRSRGTKPYRVKNFPWLGQSSGLRIFGGSAGFDCGKDGERAPFPLQEELMACGGVCQQSHVAVVNETYDAGNEILVVNDRLTNHIPAASTKLDFDGGAPPDHAWRRRLNSHANRLKEFSVTFMEAIQMVQ